MSERPKDIQSKEELQDYYVRRRHEYERSIGRDPDNIKKWFNYAKWEEEMGFISRSRSIYIRLSRAIYSDPRSWLRWHDFELRHHAVNRARNLLLEACRLIPGDERLWLKRLLLEEQLDDIAAAVKTWEGWLPLYPSLDAFRACFGFCDRHKLVNLEREAAIWLMEGHHTWEAYNLARNTALDDDFVFQQAIRELGARGEDNAAFYTALADWHAEHDRISDARESFRQAYTKGRGVALLYRWGQWELKNGFQDNGYRLLSESVLERYKSEIPKDSDCLKYATAATRCLALGGNWALIHEVFVVSLNNASDTFLPLVAVHFGHAASMAQRDEAALIWVDCADRLKARNIESQIFFVEFAKALVRQQDPLPALELLSSNPGPRTTPFHAALLDAMGLPRDSAFFTYMRSVPSAESFILAFNNGVEDAAEEGLAILRDVELLLFANWLAMNVNSQKVLSLFPAVFTHSHDAELYALFASLAIVCDQRSLAITTLSERVLSLPASDEQKILLSSLLRELND